MVRLTPHPYEALEGATRTNKHMTEGTIHEFIQGLNVSDSVKAELDGYHPQQLYRNLTNINLQFPIATYRSIYHIPYIYKELKELFLKKLLTQP